MKFLWQGPSCVDILDARSVASASCNDILDKYSVARGKLCGYIRSTVSCKGRVVRIHLMKCLWQGASCEDIFDESSVARGGM